MGQIIIWREIFPKLKTQLNRIVRFVFISRLIRRNFNFYIVNTIVRVGGGLGGGLAFGATKSLGTSASSLDVL